MWLIPVLVLGLSAALAVPLVRYLAAVLDRPSANRLERLLDTGGQSWNGYCFSLL